MEIVLRAALVGVLLISFGVALYSAAYLWRVIKGVW